MDRMTPHHWVNHLRCHGPPRLGVYQGPWEGPWVLGREPHCGRRPVPRVEAADRGLWILQVQSMDEAVEWAECSRSRHCPGSIPTSTAPRELEIRQVFEPEE
jgi:hypothetical protein